MSQYALALSDEEQHRYRMMAESALVAERDLWTAAGVVDGATVADVGCGPGAVTAVLAQLVGPAGRVFAVDAGAEAVAAARAMCEQAGVANVTVQRGPATATGLDPSGFDVVMVRHVLAHNAPDEQAIVDHLATLVRPGGCVYLADNDGTAVRQWPSDPDLEDLTRRYQAWHESQGNDLMVGLRLAALLEAAGLEVLEHRGRYQLIPSTPGLRGPSWAGREALLAAGLATDDDVARWDAAFGRVDSGDLRFTIFVPQFCAFARRPQ